MHATATTAWRAEIGSRPPPQPQPQAVRCAAVALLAASLLAIPLPASAGAERVAVKLLELLLQRVGATKTSAVVAAEQLIANGQDELARPYLKALAQPHLKDGDAVTRSYAEALERTADDIARVDGWALPSQPFGGSVRITERAAFQLQDDPGRTAVLRGLAEMRSDVGLLDVVPVSVKTFGDEFARGFRDPDLAFGAIKDTHGDLWARWQSTAPERRVFVIGSRSDAPQVARLRERLRRERGEVFFYEFCSEGNRPLCPSSAVGAFFATSGQTLVMQSADAAASGFVRLEVAVAQRLQGRRMPFLVLSSQDLMAAGARGGRTVAHALASRAAGAVGADRREGASSR